MLAKTTFYIFIRTWKKIARETSYIFVCNNLNKQVRQNSGQKMDKWMLK